MLQLNLSYNTGLFLVFNLVVRICSSKNESGNESLFNDVEPPSFSELGEGLVGVQLAPKHFPHNVQLANSYIMCGGTIVNSWALFTAAHCFDLNRDMTLMYVIAGAATLMDDKADWYGVQQYIMHEKYDFVKTFHHDIALVFVKHAFKFGERVQRALLVDHLSWMKNTKNNFHVIGWGYFMNQTNINGTNVLLQASMSFVPIEECVKHKDTSIEAKFCLLGAWQNEACFGDSGGSVTWNGFDDTVL